MSHDHLPVHVREIPDPVPILIQWVLQWHPPCGGVEVLTARYRPEDGDITVLLHIQGRYVLVPLPLRDLIAIRRSVLWDAFDHIVFEYLAQDN